MIMKNIIIITLIAGLTGCQSSPPPLTANKLSELSNEDLCRALGTYNNDGELVLKIYDELKKRPGKISSERCYTLEKINEEQYVESKGNDTRTNIPYTNNINTNPLHSNNNYQYIDPQHHKIIYNPRINDKNNEKDADSLEKINSLNRMSIYQNEPIFSTKEIVKDKLDIKEEDMNTIMRECLKKHISKPQSHVNSDK